MVVATVRPIAALVEAVMVSAGGPVTLIPPDQAPESFVLRGADMDTLRQADLVFWVGPSLEGALAKPLADLETGARIVELSETAGLLIHPPRRGGEWDLPAPASRLPDSRSPDEVGGPQGADGHLWLDADNVKLLIGRIAMALTDVDFGHAEIYRMNAAALRKRVDALDQEIARELSPLRGGAFLPLHDAFQYWEVRYGLEGEGSISVPAEPLTEAALQEIAAKVARAKARCILGGPDSDAAALAAIGAATGVRTDRIDIYGDGQGGSGDLFLDMMRKTADGFARCLGDGENLSQTP